MLQSNHGWGSAVGFGVDVYGSTKNCNSNSGPVTGSAIISTSPSGCYYHDNSTSNGASCSKGNINFNSYSASTTCTGKYGTESMPKTGMCGTIESYDVPVGYGYYKCYNL